jgi:hypothetical protein
MDPPDATDRSYGAPTVRTTHRARERIGRAVFKSWEKRDIDELTRLMRKFADAMTVDPPAVS